MNLKQIQELIKFVAKSGATEVDLEMGDVKICIKLAEKISKYQKEFNRKIKIFIQVNLSNEKQKSGVDLNNLNNFYNYCTNEISLNIIGLMCLPPIHADPNEFFKKLKTASDNLKLKDLSMGMSGDYEDAISNGSTYLRLGTVILGKRNS